MESAIVLLSAAAAILPLAVYVGFIWWLDRYDREPVALLAGTLVWGAVGGASFAIVLSSAVQTGVEASLGSGRAADVLGAVLVAPFVEEASKGAVLLALLFSAHFDNATDGIVYGAAAGLGFAMTENFFYFMQAAQGGAGAFAANVAIRTLFTALVHACSTATLGFFVGLSRHRRTRTSLLLVPVGYGLAVGIHAFWNGSLTARTLSPQATPLGMVAYLALPTVVLLLIGVIQTSLYLEHRMLLRELAEEEHLGYLPAGHAAILPWVLRRSRRGWLPAGVPQRRYVQLATRLAFRKDQARGASPAAAARRLGEVDELRRHLAQLVLGAPPPSRTTTAWVESPAPGERP